VSGKAKGGGGASGVAGGRFNIAWKVKKRNKKQKKTKTTRSYSMCYGFVDMCSGEVAACSGQTDRRSGQTDRRNRRVTFRERAREVQRSARQEGDQRYGAVPCTPEVWAGRQPVGATWGEPRGEVPCAGRECADYSSTGRQQRVHATGIYQLCCHYLTLSTVEHVNIDVDHVDHALYFRSYKST
jgi:hypothetical protein